MPDLKTYDGVAAASIKTINGVPIANVKAINGVDVPDGFTPASDANLIAWYDSTEGITDVAGAVSQWDVKSGSASTKHLVQSTEAAKPTTDSRTVNSINVLDCDGGDFMSVTTFPIPSSGNVSIFMMVAIDSIDNSIDSIHSLDGATNDYQVQANSATQFDGKVLGGGGITSSGTFNNMPFSGNFIFHLVFDFDGSIYSPFIDNVLEDTGGVSYTTKLDASMELIIFANRGKSIFPNGAFGDVIVTESIDASTVSDHYNYLKDKYGL